MTFVKFDICTYPTCHKLIPVKLALYATAFSRYAPLKVEPLKSDSLISAAVKLALLYQSFRMIMNRGH